MSAELLGLEIYCSSKFDGLLNLKYIPIQNLISLPELKQTDGTYSGSFNPALTEWHNLAFISSVNKPNITIKPRDFKNGNVKQVAINASIYSDNEAILNELEKMEQMRFAVLATDRKGQLKIIGNKETPLNFSWQHQVGNNTNTYNLQFSGLLKAAPTIYKSI